jgi:hypothetical protein
MSTPERQQDPGEHGYGSAKQDEPTDDDEHQETPQEREEEVTAEGRRLAEERSEDSSEGVDEHVPPTDEVAVPSDDDEDLGSQ